MNTIEYGHYDIASNEAEFKDIILKAIKFNPNIISVLPSYTKLAKNLIPDHILLSTVVDYPLGTSDLKTRLLSTENSLKNNCKVIEVVVPTYFLCNRKYDKFREDISEHSALCKQYNAELRYMLEYRVFTSDLLYKASQILITHNIEKIYPSTGHLLDDLSDNILASALVNQKVPGMKIIINGNIWNDRHFDMLLSNKKIFGCKTNSLYSLEKLCKI